MSNLIAETPAALDQLDTGRRVADAQHDIWVKQPDGKWRYSPEAYILTAEHLLQVWAPLTIIPKEGI